MQRRNARHGTYQTRAFDAGGRNVSFENKYKVRAGRNLYNTVTRDLRYDYDGDGHQVRQRVYVNGTQQTGETKLQIWSSVLGMFISETDHGGGKVTTKVTANGSVIAEQLNYAGTNDDVVTWIHADPVSGSSSRTHKDGTLWYRTEYEPLGQEINVFGTDEEFPDPPNTGSTAVAADDPQWQCQVASQIRQSFFDQPTHCQRSQHANAQLEDFAPWVVTQVRLTGNGRTRSRAQQFGMDDTSNEVLAFSRRSTDKPKKDASEQGEDPDIPNCGTQDCVVNVKGPEVAGFVDASEDIEESYVAVTFQSNEDALEALKDVVKGDCESQLKKLFANLRPGPKEGDNAIRSNDLIELFQGIAKQKSGGFYFNSSMQDTANHFFNEYGSKGEVAGGGGAAFVNKNKDMNVYVYARYAQVRNTDTGKSLSAKTIASNVAKQRRALTQVLVHELAHAAGVRQTFSHASMDAAALLTDPDLANPSIYNGGGTSSSFNAFLFKHCNLTL